MIREIGENGFSDRSLRDIATAVLEATFDTYDEMGDSLAEALYRARPPAD